MLGPGISREPPIEEPVEELEGPSAPELRLEEEEPVEESPQPLRLEESAEVEVAAEAVAPEPARPGVIRLFGHELEELAGAGEVSVLRCIRCGAEAPLTEAAALRERPCNPSAGAGGGFCRVCGKTGIESGYCDECAKGVEEYALVARPLVDYERRPVKVLPPEEKADGWAWVGTHRTFFPYLAREGGRAWPCPACGIEYRRLVDAMEHFANAHPERTGGFERVFDVKTRMDYWRSWQGYVCPACGRLVDPAKHKCGEGK